ncbi:hypothetical protein MKW98_007980 [Papaver atlanticum]|uniref:HMA domain-containing protein n=1 Tax=Papaver atlanticum TaxID=357466 RepID=A0AAD4S7H4_9MAGN|nr:hypothetical protein MKW98_007980 [Papaver atlanticum]
MMVVKMDISDDKYKLKAMKSLSGFAGVDSISWDMKEAHKKLTIIGDIDPLDVLIKLRKHSHTELLLVGPVVIQSKTLLSSKTKLVVRFSRNQFETKQINSVKIHLVK